MKVYKTLEPVRLSTGLLKLTKEQAKRRLHCLKKVSDGVYELTGPTQFKANEVFGYSGKMPKITRNIVEEVTHNIAQEVEPDEVPKPPARETQSPPVKPKMKQQARR